MPSCPDECLQKQRTVVQYMDHHNLDAIILTRRCNFAWFTGGGLNHVGTAADTGAASLVITRGRTVCMTNAIESPRIADEELTGLGIEVRAFEWYDRNEAARLWKDELGDRRAACDARVAGLPDSVSSLGSDFAALRWSLCEPEIKRLRSLARDTAACLENVCRQARRGTTEHLLAGKLAGALIERGIRAPVVLVAADERIGRYRHPIPTSSRFDRYGIAVIGGERGGLIASCTRLFSFGPISSDLRHRHEAVCKIDAAMIGHTRPGRTLGEVFAVARQAYAEAGFPDEWKRHHQGGPTGYLAREAKASPDNPTEVLSNQAFAWNPSVAGTKSEDTILVGPGGTEILTATSQWPATSYPAGGRDWQRPNILAV